MPEPVGSNHSFLAYPRRLPLIPSTEPTDSTDAGGDTVTLSNTAAGHHDPGSAVQHMLHKGKLTVHLVKDAGEAATEVAEMRTASSVLAAGPLPRAARANHLGNAVLSGHQAAALERATQALNDHNVLNRAAESASRDQSSAARRLNRAISDGRSTPQQIQGLRDQVAEATNRANQAQQAAQKAKTEAEAARQTIQGLEDSVDARKGLQRATAGLAESQEAQRALELVRRGALSNVGQALTTAAKSKVVKVGGKVLIGAAVAGDAYMATRSDATNLGNTTRAVGQGAVSTIMYTQPALLPVLAAEAFLMDKPHITGPVQAAVQTLGVAADYLSGGSDRGDQSLSRLDQEMKDGTYGGVIKGANHIGQAIADKGAGEVVSEAADYWSQTSPGQVLSDVQSLGGWLFGGD